MQPLAQAPKLQPDAMPTGLRPDPTNVQPATSEAGLSQAEAQARLAKYGYNELTEHKTNPVLKFLSYFWGPIPWMIEVAAILSAVVRHWDDFGIVLALLVMNGVAGFWEEFQAGNAIAALKAKLALHARVRRDGAWTTIPERELVPGDLHYRIAETIRVLPFLPKWWIACISRRRMARWREFVQSYKR